MSESVTVESVPAEHSLPVLCCSNLLILMFETLTVESVPAEAIHVNIAYLCNVVVICSF